MMGCIDDTVRRIHADVAAMGRQRGPWLLAVSGGVDSMVLLDAAATVLARQELVVATFDHGTGPAATAAVALVAARTQACALQCVVGRASVRGTSEAVWRAERWR